MTSRNQSGFTLIELLIASIVIAISITAVFSAFTTVEKLNLRARNLTIANQLVQQQVETYRNTPFAGLPAGGSSTDVSNLMSPYPSLGTPRTMTANVTDIDVGDLKQIDVALSYTEGGQTKRVQASTLITVRGLNK